MMNTQSLHNELASVVMRTIGCRRREIRRALTCLVANSYVPLELVIVFQGPDDKEWNNVQQLVDDFPELEIRLIRNLRVGDARAENLNIGWKLAKGRYVCFLDDDDTVEPSHIMALVEGLKRSGKAWAYANCFLVKEDENLNVVEKASPFYRNGFNFHELWHQNFLPIHSFLVDRFRIQNNLQDNPFCEELTRSEDWDFLLRLAYHHEPERIDSFTCTYHISTSTRNTNQSFNARPEKNEQASINQSHWERNKILIHNRKKELASHYWWANGLLGANFANSNEIANANLLQLLKEIHIRVRRKFKYIIGKVL